MNAGSTESIGQCRTIAGDCMLKLGMSFIQWQALSRVSRSRASKASSSGRSCAIDSQRNLPGVPRAFGGEGVSAVGISAILMGLNGNRGRSVWQNSPVPADARGGDPVA